MANVGTESTRVKLLGLLPVNGQWMAVVQAFTTTRRGAVVATLCDPASLQGSQRATASRWLAELGAPLRA